MRFSVHMERKDSTTLGEWEEFLASGRRLGAAGSTEVAEDYDEEDPYRPRGWMIEADGNDGSGPEKVTLPADLVRDLLHVATAVSSGGDPDELERTAKTAVDQVNEHFRRAMLGPGWRQ